MRRMVTNAEIEKLGGTKLYKHKATFYVNIDGDDISVKAEFITANGESLAGETIEIMAPIGGILIYDYTYYPLFYLDEYSCFFYNTDSQEIAYFAVGGSGKFSADIVEAL